MKTVKREKTLKQAVENNRTKLTAVVRSRIRDKTEADDIVQDVFIEFLEAYDLGVAIENLSAWLVQVAKSKVVDRFRRKKVRDDYTAMVQAASEDEASDSESPDKQAMSQLMRTAIASAVESLPPEQKEVYVLNELEGKTFEEIAQATGISINTLLSRKRYAVNSLRQKLKEIYDGLE